MSLSTEKARQERDDARDRLRRSLETAESDLRPSALAEWLLQRADDRFDGDLVGRLGRLVVRNPLPFVLGGAALVSLAIELRSGDEERCSENGASNERIL